MTHFLHLLASCLMIAAGSSDRGSISGTVHNASSGKSFVSQAEVVLRVQLNNQSVICGETITDDAGRFVFDDLALDPDLEYQPGANRDGIHYPGTRVHLTLAQPQARVDLDVCDTLSAPNPLIIRCQEIRLQLEPDLLRVTECLRIENPEMRTYVGLAAEEGEPVTLQLSIPPEFQRITFQQEFYGRRFCVHEGKLATSIPWPPGTRELKYTYILPVEPGQFSWRRMLDLSCRELRLVVQTDHPEEVACNLSDAPSSTPGQLAFQSSAGTLPPGHLIRVDLGKVPMPLMYHARWIAVIIMIILMAGSAGILTNLRKIVKLAS
jgi:hypothetical protein